MKTTILLSGLMLFAASSACNAFAQAPAASASTSASASEAEAGKPAEKAEAAKGGGKLSCDQLKQKVESHFVAHGVKQYTLDVVDSAQDSSGKVVGHCDGGTHKLVYTKGAATK